METGRFTVVTVLSREVLMFSSRSKAVWRVEA